MAGRSPAPDSTCARRARAASTRSTWSCGLGEISDQPRRDHRVIGGVARLEKAFRRCEGDAVAIAGERRQHPSELGERHRDVGTDRLSDHLGSCGQQLRRLVVAAHRGDQRDGRVGRRGPLWLSELLGEAPRLGGRGQRCVPVADAGGHARAERQQTRQMAEPSFRPQAVDRRRKEVVAQVERSDDERRRSEEASGVSVDPLAGCRALEARENPGRMTQWIRIRVDGEHARVIGVGVSQPVGCADQFPPRPGPGSSHQAREATSQRRSTCRS